MATPIKVCSELLARMIFAAGLLLVAAGVSAADVAFREGFDSPEPTWKLTGGEHARLVEQKRVQDPDLGGHLTSERLKVRCTPGYSARVDHPVGVAPVLEELEIEIFLRSNAPGVQLAAQIVFPRSTDPETGRPVRSVVYGSRYANVNQWQSLSMSELPKLAKRQARILNTSSAETVDVREAYVDKVVLVVPGDNQAVEVEVDELLVKGVVMAGGKPATEKSIAHTPAFEGPELTGPLVGNTENEGNDFAAVEIRRRGDTLTVNNRPFVPRLVTHNGESFDALAKMGFHGIWLNHVPSATELSDAHQAKLWIVCPPPDAKGLESIDANSPWQVILGWSLGQEKNGAQIDSIRAQTEMLRLGDTSLGRPLIVGAGDHRRQYAQMADVLIDAKRPEFYRKGSATSPWQLPVLGCSNWISVETHLSQSAAAQAAVFAPRHAEIATREGRNVRQTVLDAVAGSARGILIRSGENLTSNQPHTRRLALQLELMNRELELLAPWLESGKKISGAELEGMSTRLTTWQLARAKLVLIPPHDAPANGPSTRRPALLIAGVAETASAHLLTPAGLSPLPANRGPGGLRIDTGDVSAGAMVLVTNDSRAIAQLQRHTVKRAEATAKGERELAMAEVQRLEAVAAQLTSYANRTQADPFADLKAHLRQCDLLLAGRNYPRATQLARQLRHQLADRESQLAEKTKIDVGGFESLPTDFGIVSLPMHSAMQQTIYSLPRGPNVLVGGDFEQLEQLQSAGWINTHYEASIWKSEVEITGVAPRHGSSALRLIVRDSADSTTHFAESMPVVWITSPEVDLAKRTIVEISGWARVAAGKAERKSKLWVVDSLGGRQLALKIGTTRGWQPFRLIRATTGGDKLDVTFALDGPGVADVDAVMVREVRRPGATARMQGAQPAQVK